MKVVRIHLGSLEFIWVVRIHLGRIRLLISKMNIFCDITLYLLIDHYN